MLKFVGMILAAGLLLAADEPAKDAVKKEYEDFRGTWKFVSIEVEGKKVPEDNFKNSRLILKGDKFTVTEGQATYRGTFTMDLAKNPKTIDVTFTEGPEKGSTTLGIYELEGDTYKVCMGMPGK